MKAMNGSWAPCSRILYGIVTYPFQPLAVSQDQAATANDQVPLEIGDEVYTLEVFRPDTIPQSQGDWDGTWHRGFLVTGQKTQVQAHQDSTDAVQVFFGIWPSLNVQISEELDHVPTQTLMGQVEPNDNPTLQRSASSAQKHIMEPLQEEDEEAADDLVEGINGYASHRMSKRMPDTPDQAGHNAKQRNRLSIASIASAASPALALVAQEDPQQTKSQALSNSVVKPNPPLPSLKCGDETASGVREPLVDEVACALREWSQLLFTHLSNRDYAKFHEIKREMDTLHSARRQLLSGALSRQEAEQIRADLVQRLAKGNSAQGLDLIVRHPTHGSLVEVDTLGPSWVSVVQLYSMQAKLAYINAADLASRQHHQQQQQHATRITTHTSELFAQNETSRGTTGHKRNDSTLSITQQGDLSSAAPSPSRFYHLYFEMRSFVTSPCAPGELSEFYFSVYNDSEKKFITEDYCIVLNHQNIPVPLTLGKLCTLFKDLTAQDLLEPLYLVCRIIKNGSFKAALPASASTTSLLAPPSNNSELRIGKTNNRASATPSFEGVDFMKSSMLHSMSNTSQQSARRPLGCAVLDLSFLRAEGAGSASSTAPMPTPLNYQATAKDEQSMPVFMPATENGFANLHQDIIASRTDNFMSSPEKAKTITLSTKIFHGVVSDVVDAQVNLANAPLTERLGFPDVPEPETHRNDLYIRLNSGFFESAGASSSGSGSLRRGIRNIQHFASASAAQTNVEVSVEVRRKNGSLVEDCISRGAGEPLVSTFVSLIVKGCSAPVFDELFKLVMEPNSLENSHLFFTFRSRTSKERNSMTALAEKPFAFAWLPLFPDDVTCLSDGKHELQLYRYHPDVAVPAVYFELSSHHIPTPVESKRASSLRSLSQSSMMPSASQLSLNMATSAQAAKQNVTPQPLRDSLTITSLSCSTSFSQDETLLRLLRWQSSPEILSSTDDVLALLSKLKYCSESELAKHIQPVLDALFALLTSNFNADSQLDSAVFGNLVAIFAIVSDRRFHNFKAIVDRYLTERFHFTAYKHLLSGMLQLLSDHNAAGEAPQALRAAIKVWPLLFKTIIRSRELQRTKTVGSNVTSDSIEATFKHELTNIFGEINKIMMLQAPPSIIGTQVLAMQHFAGIVDSVATIFSQREILDIVVNFCDAISNATGKLATHKLLLLARLSEGPALNSAADRSVMIPDFVRWIRPHLIKLNDFDLRSMNDGARVNAQIQWTESARAAVVVLAAMLHKIHTGLVHPAISTSESAIVLEQDNLEFMLGLLPRLLEYYGELQSDQLLRGIQQNPTQVAAASIAPSVFPTAHPFYLLSKEAEATEVPVRLTLRHLKGELAAVIISMLQLCRGNVITNFLEATLEVEGTDHFINLLTHLFRFERAIIEQDAFPGSWLNFNLVAHRVILKSFECCTPLMQREYIPPQDSTFLFNYTLWREFLEALFTLLKSDQLVIEDFAPQKRRAVWRQAGDLRGTGAKLLHRVWDSLGWPDSYILPGSVTSLGGYQVQLSPSFIDSVLELCLSHHDELRSTAVHIMFSIIIGESRLNSDLGAIQNQVIDTLDRLFSQKKGDEVSRGFFINQLRSMFGQAQLDQSIRSQVDRFLDSTSHFLDLLLGIRNLPAGDEYLDDRIIGTLRLMSYIRDISSSQIFCKYVHRLKDYHVQCGNFTEAGLVLKLHADLYDYNTNSYVDAIPEYDLPKQSHFARKEVLYLQILELLNQGKAWESALVICKELQDRYELVNFAYQRLSEILLHQSTLYSKIVKEHRTYPNCFRVAYYGKGFPATVQNRQFVYRGNEGEKLGAFRERHMNKHPSAILLDYQSIPEEKIQNADCQFMQICQVKPEPDRSFPIFQNQDVPAAVRSYYEHNGTNIFTFETKFSKAAADHAWNTSVSIDFLSTWSLRTVLICADAFPTVLKRTEVTETRTEEVSPVEKALANVEQSVQELQTLARKYTALQNEGSTRINSNPLSMSLNSVVDPGNNSGVPLYRRAFLGPEFIVANPDKAGTVDKLKEAIEQLTMAVQRTLRLHGEVCGADMMAFHETLKTFFYRNFAAEIERFGNEETPEAWFEFSLTGSDRAPSQSENKSDPQSQDYVLPIMSTREVSSAQASPAIPPKNKGRYSVSLGAETFGDHLTKQVPSTTSDSVVPDSSRPMSPGDTASLMSDATGEGASKSRRAGSLLRFGSMASKKPTGGRRNGSIGA